MDNGKKDNGLLKSIKAVANKVSEKAVNAVESIKIATVQWKEDSATKQALRKENIAEKKRQDDLVKLAPIFIDDINRNNIFEKRVIRIVNYDSRLENEVCKDSVGFYEKSDGKKIPTLYFKYAQQTGLSFYPKLSESVFVADPYERNKYIEIDEYYNYMKQVRVNELTLLAQALGAKSVTIELKSSNSSEKSLEKSMQLKAANTIGASCNLQNNAGNFNSIEIWASTTFKTDKADGIIATMPQLLYFKNESDISSLIQMAMSNKSKLRERKYSMKASSSSGMSVNEAISIEESLKKIKCNAGVIFSNAARNESTAILEYTIKF